MYLLIPEKAKANERQKLNRAFQGKRDENWDLGSAKKTRDLINQGFTQDKRKSEINQPLQG